ncbi:amidinotransferase [Serratia sp. JSRIV001]|uniref:amidinotransferase n=1 Tax=Serratia sp. JSRIV001 TaxID=2831893 RepID=UPI001CBD956B|nr:amidinotransferase [Serratia sp. JSRIV001]UAN44204.1 amidinotransferase [Serratia sp. JSRIV001]
MNTVFKPQDNQSALLSQYCAVSSYTEWDPLEEVIVGVVDGACFPPWHVALEPVLPAAQHSLFQRMAGRSFPVNLIDKAREELEEFVCILTGEGVTVRRPVPQDQTLIFGAPGWSSSGLYCAMPRDVLLVIGNDIIECPLAWRSRYFEVSAYKPLLKEYFNSGARWSAGPKPQLTDEQFDPDWEKNASFGTIPLVVTEFEPTFDAADFARCGRDIIAQKSNVTNAFGIEWLRRHLGSEYRVHVLEFDDKHPMHIDATLVPLAPGKLLVNPERVREKPSIFKNWDMLLAPEPIVPDSHPLYMTSKWINMNILMLDEHRVIVEAQDEPMIRKMKSWGFTPIPCNFRCFNSFGGSFHCATLDVRRRGNLQSYL